MSLVIHNLKRLRTEAERLLAWERSTCETVEPHYSAHQAPATLPLHQHKNKDLSEETIQPSPSIDFLERFHDILPRELRDLVYAHILGLESGTWTIQPHSLYFRFDPRVADVPTRLRPRALEDSSDRIFSVVRLELATYFFSTNTIVLRYHCDSATLDILTRLCRHTACRPTQYIKRLQIFVCPPDCAEDEMCCDEEAEFEWHHMYPVSKNARSLAQRRQLETDLYEIAQHINKRYETEVTFMVSEQEWQGFDRARRNGRVGCVVLKTLSGSDSHGMIGQGSLLDWSNARG